MKFSTLTRLAAAAGALALVGGTAATTVAGAAEHARHGHAMKLTIAAHPAVVLANGTATTRVAVRASHGKAARNVAVSLSTSGTGCGQLAATSGMTGRNGMLVETYTASSTVGFCAVTATAGTATATAYIDQIDPTLAAANTRYSVSLASSAHAVKADGTSTVTITATVLNGTTPVAGDQLIAVTRALRPGACGTISAAAATSDTNGQDVFTYTASSKAGNCFVFVAEASTAGHAVVVIHQR